MATQHKVVLNNGVTENRTWEVDTSALGRISYNDWLTRFPQLLEQDLREMGSMFPHWILVGGNSQDAVSCPDDREYIVPKEGKMRCLKCDRSYEQTLSSLIWTGMLPVRVERAGRVERNIKRLEKGRELRLPFVKGFLLVPIKIVYPQNWPHGDPGSYYTPEFFQALGVDTPGISHHHHMNGGLRMCLFSNWHQMSIMEVIQNRIGPHALAQVMLASGERPKSWFTR